MMPNRFKAVPLRRTERSPLDQVIRHLVVSFALKWLTCRPTNDDPVLLPKPSCRLQWLFPIATAVDSLLHGGDDRLSYAETGHTGERARQSIRLGVVDID